MMCNGVARAKLIKHLHIKIKQEIKNKVSRYATTANKGRKKKSSFNLKDWVWMHLRNDIYLNKRKSKLQNKGKNILKFLKE